MKKDILYLGSQSNSRQKLLRIAGILYKVLEHKSDECGIDLELDFNDYVLEIAKHKMRHLTFPLELEKSEYIFVLTADTLCQDKNGNVMGKPTDKCDAIEKLKQQRDGGSRAVSAFCLDKKVCKNGEWKVLDRVEECVTSNYTFIVPDKWIDAHCENTWAHRAAGAVVFEEFGSMFLKTMNGSFSAIRGLPIFELREALEKVGFFN